MTQHRHDYEMKFLNPDSPLEWTLVCSCGDIAANIEDARRKMKKPSRLSEGLKWLLLALLVGFALLAVFNLA